jgi:hypothetical protein
VLAVTGQDARGLAAVVPLPGVSQDSSPARAHEASEQRIRAEAPHLRLTRRGRVVVAASAVVVASLLWFAAASAAQASDHGAAPHPASQGMTQVVVQPGQTLWSIAAQADPTADTRLVIQRILTANSLTSENLTAGQDLWVPRG